MAAVATKKRNGDFGVQVTFPAVFQREFMGGVEFFPESESAPLDIMVGSDFQAVFHEEKKMDAHQSVRNGIQANRTKEQKLLTGPHNYHLPKPVLGQRKFANPMNGVVGFPSARRDHSSAPFAVVESGMTGGVVSTTEGQEFYRLALQRRIDQLDRLNALAQGFAVPMGQKVETYDNEKVGGPDKVKFFFYLRGLIDAIVDGKIDRFSYENMKEMTDFLFKFAPTATIEDFEDAIDGWDEALESARSFPVGDGGVDPTEAAFLESISIYLEKGKDYLEQMFRAVESPPKDRKALSKALIRSLGFTRLLKKKSPEGAVAEVARTNTRVRDGFENYDGRFGGDGPDDDGDGDGRFDRPATAREDDEQRGTQRGALAGRNADPNRERYGQRNGTIVYGGPQYFGETVRDDETPLAAPLSLSGFDPQAQLPEPDVSQLKTAVKEELLTQLTSLGWDSSRGVSEFVETELGGESDDLVRAMETSLLAKGFKKAQIARGMTELNMESLFGDYIGANTGDIAPERIQQTSPRPDVPFETPVLDVTQQQRTEPAGRPALPRGFPATRDELQREAQSYEDFVRLGAIKGIGYTPRSGSKRRNMLTRLIQIVRQKYNPNY